MKLSQNELLFLNSVTKGAAPFGILFQFPGAEHATAYQAEVLQSLKEKGILDETEKFTEKGTILLLLWECYRNSKKHLILNRMYLAEGPDSQLIGIEKKEDGYELFLTDGGTVMAAVLTKYEFLRQGNTAGDYQLEQVDYQEWGKEMAAYGEHVLMLGEYQEKEPQKEEVYYWEEMCGYRYDIRTGYRRQMSSRSMRIKLLTYFGVAKRK